MKIEHVLNGHGQKEEIIDGDLETVGTSMSEEGAYRK